MMGIDRRRILGLLGASLAAPALAHEGHRHAPRISAGLAPPKGVAIGGRFDLIDHDGRPFALGAPGPATLVFFGFTSCASVCPAALVDAAEVVKRLGAAAPRVAFVTLDPQRDTREVLAAYVANFDPRFIGLTGSTQTIEALADAYRVAFRRVPTGASYTIDHSAYTYFLDERGAVARLYPHGAPAAVIAAELNARAARIADARAARAVGQP